MKWQKGRDEVQRLLTDGALETVSDAAVDGTLLIESAGHLLESANREADALQRP